MNLLCYLPILVFYSRSLDCIQNDQNQLSASDLPSATEEESNLQTSRFASETAESEQESLNAYKEATANAKTAPQIIIEPPNLQGHGDADNIRLEEDQRE